MFPSHDPVFQNISRAINSHVAGQREKQLHEIAIERAKMDLVGKKLENDLLQSQLTNVNRQAGDAPVPLWIEVWDQRNKKMKWLPNPQAVEGVESAGFLAGTVMSGDLAAANVTPAYMGEVAKVVRRHERNATKGKGTPIMDAWARSRKEVWNWITGKGPRPKAIQRR